ncbi:hypothetical protein PISL3812_08127 [Talaromyces islandicus]|uniref:Myb-like domain-containing protein n=1 Tax=Talaromyces islandicus TaxID=28573 RepID=A0A0U1M652_TALIS|nr:hypothetical protein PISL3812_08127 [Talaromyces islandicus]
MAITMEKIKFYRPPSLPVRPTQKYPANRPSPLHCHSSYRTYSSTPTPQYCPLPPRPPVTVPSSAISRSGNTSRPFNSPVYPNDFDRAIQEFPHQSVGVFTQGEDRKDEEREDPLIPDGQECEDHGGNLLCSTLEKYPSSPITSSTPTTNEAFAQPPNTDLAPLQSQDHEIRTGNADPMSPTRPMTPSVSSEELVSTSVSTDLRLNDASPQFPTPGPISTREGKAARHENSHTSVILDSQDVESCVQSVPHNEEAHRQDTSTVSEQGTTCQPDEPASVSSLPSIAVVMPVSSRSLTAPSKRPLSSNQFDIEPLLVEDDNDSILSDDADDADYIDDNILEADQRPPASKRRKVNSSAYSSRNRRATRLSKNIYPSQPVQQELGQAAQQRQTSSARSEDVYSFTGLRSSFLETSFEGRLEFLSWLFEGILSQGMPESGFAQSPPLANMTEAHREDRLSRHKSRENKPWKPEEKDLLRQLKKKEQLSWSAIEKRFAEKFPERSIGAIQVHWCTKLKDEPEV